MSKFIHLLLIFTLMVHVFTPFVFAQDSLTDLEKQINDLKSKIESAQTQERSLAAEIKSMSDKIQLTTLEISETTSKIAKLAVEIEELGTKIGRLDVTLSKLSQLLINRVVASYKLRRVSPFVLLLSSANFTDGLKKILFLQIAQEHDREVLVEVQLAKVDYSEKKDLREEKKKQLEDLKKQLDQQKIKLDQQKFSKESLLKITKNSETVYQQMLLQAIAEKQAIEIALSSGVKEGPVKSGSPIALIGNTGSPHCSTGAHLHFTVKKNGETVNPFTYLRSGISNINSSRVCVYGKCTPNDPFNPSGSWSWPIMETITLTQGFGVTEAVKAYHYYEFHDGIDITSDSPVIRAPKDGTLYSSTSQCCRVIDGVYGCSTLKAKSIDHGEGLYTVYLHVQ